VKARFLPVVPRLFSRGQLLLEARRQVDGLYAGGHRTRSHGSSLEFAEHRLYVPGDDPRSIDWRAYARSDRLVVRRYHEERRLPVRILIDASISMTYGSKLDAAVLVAAMLGLLALDAGDDLEVLMHGLTERRSPPLQGTTGAERLCRFLEEDEGGRRADATTLLTRLRDQSPRRSLVILISDFVGEIAPLAELARVLTGMGHDLAAIQVLDPSELALPAAWGETLLHDRESGLQVACDARTAKAAYDANISAHITGLRAALLAANVDHLLLSDPQSLTQALSAWLVRRRTR
jgi:uncharacterized protein (DUF58 family)